MAIFIMSTNDTIHANQRNSTTRTHGSPVKIPRNIAPRTLLEWNATKCTNGSTDNKNTTDVV